jgi:hypothetical protein
MKQSVVFSLSAVMLAGAASIGVGAQTPATPPTLVVEVQRMFNNIKNNFTKSADQFPEEKYDWKPTPDVRTWAGLFGHLIDDNNGSCAPLIGETAPPRLDNEGQPTDAAKGLKKADIVRLLAESFARCDKAFAAVTADNMLERSRPGNVNRSKIGALIYNTQHISEHYGNAVTYMRLQGLVPPSSAPQPGRGRGMESR